MLKPVLNRRSCSLATPDCPADNQARQLALFFIRDVKVQLILPGLARHESEERNQTAGLDGSDALVQGSRFRSVKIYFLKRVEIGILEQVSGKKG